MVCLKQHSNVYRSLLAEGLDNQEAIQYIEKSLSGWFSINLALR